MEDVVVCPNCGENNPPDLPYCQYCQWRLRSLDGEWGSQAGIGATGQAGADPGAFDGEGTVPDWLSAARDQAVDKTTPLSARAEHERPLDTPSFDEDLLSGLAHLVEAEQEQIPDWVARIIGISEPDESAEAPSSSDGHKQLDEAPLELPASLQSPEVGQQDMPSWSRDAGTPGAASGVSEAIDDLHAAVSAENTGNENTEVYEWLRQLDASAATAREPRAEPKAPSEGDVPSWIEGMTGVPGQGAARLGAALPDSLVDAAPSSAESATEPPEPSAPRTPDDFSAPQTTDPTIAEAAADASRRPEISPAISQEVVPAFRPAEIDRLDVDAVFASMQMPDWLADLTSHQSISSPALLPAAQDEEPIAPADLPSWVEAMRPVDSGMVRAAGIETDVQFEAGGPLLGLHGILPAIAGAAQPSSRPKPHSMKLEASERQHAHAKLLENTLAAETQPLPLKGAGQLGSEHVLRWVISVLLVSVIGGAVLSGSRNFPLPASVPNESIAAIHAIQSLAPDALVLAVFDYEPATVGEMEATAASLMDHLLLLKHPRLAVISTSPTGSALAERFLSGTLAERAYARGVQYVNLGYLPGGLAGVQSFAQDPTATVPLGASSDHVWDSGVLLGTRRLSDFAAIIVLTESLESGRVWIEQTTATRGSSLMILVASAQAGPMLLPYFSSGQADGLIVGLNGAAGAEIANSGFPGLVRRYWDAYSLGLYLAVLLITLGALWHFWVGLRERRIEAE